MQSSDNQSSDNPSPSPVTLDPGTLKLAAEEVRRLILQQQQERQLLFNQLNILFLTNSALLTFLVLSKLIFVKTLFTILEIPGLLGNFFLIFSAIWPRPTTVSPNLQDKDKDFLGTYLPLEPDE